ncbi:MAG: hypothetical protein Q9221_008680 [Calogaya cf. arnoldii]
MLRQPDMDDIDVEAAALRGRAVQDPAFDEGGEAQDHHSSHSSLIPTSTADGKQHETLQRMAQALTEKLLGCLMTLVQEELHNSRESHELFAPASSQKGATLESQMELEVDHEGLGKEEDRENRPRQEQVPSDSLQSPTHAPDNKGTSGRIHGKFESIAPQGPT